MPSLSPHNLQYQSSPEASMCLARDIAGPTRSSAHLTKKRKLDEAPPMTRRLRKPPCRPSRPFPAARKETLASATKRKISDSDFLTEDQRPAKKTILTSEALRHLESETHLFDASRGLEWKSIYTPSTMSQPSRRPSTIGSSTRSGGAYGSNFLREMQTRGIYDEKIPSRQPQNIEEIKQVLKSQRRSPPPTQADFDQHRLDVSRCPSEATLQAESFPIFYKTSGWFRNPIHKPAHKQRWNNCLHPGQGIQDLEPVKPEPDYQVGVDSSCLPTSFLIALGGFATPANDGMALPNFFAHLKSPNGHMQTAHRQSMQDGAYGTYNYLQARQALNEEDSFYDTAEVFSSEYDGHQILINAHWVSKGPDGLEFHMTTISAHILNGPNLDQFQRGCREIRNVQDHAGNIRERLAEQLRTERRTGYDHLTPLQSSHESAATSSASQTLPPPESPKARAEKKGLRKSSRSRRPGRGNQESWSS